LNELPSSEAEELTEKIRKCQLFVIKTRDLSTRLFQGLSKTIDACERFCRQDANYFRIPSTSGDTHQQLNPIPTLQITFDNLFKMKQALGFTTGRLEQFAKDVSQNSLEALLYSLKIPHGIVANEINSLTHNSISEMMN
jgi:hypothetical protein